MSEARLTESERESLAAAMTSRGCWDSECCWSSFEAVVPTVEAILAVRLTAVEALHRPVQWEGWRLWAMRLGREPRAFFDRWCIECRQPWPCSTAAALAAQPTTTEAS